MIGIARGLMSLIFLFAGAGKIMNWQESVNAVEMIFSRWYMYLEGGVMTSDMHEFLMANSSTLLGIAAFLELGGGLLLLLGWKPRLGALMLLVFLIPTTLLFHPFWFEVGSDFNATLGIFIKNVSLIGALLYLFVTSRPVRDRPVT